MDHTRAPNGFLSYITPDPGFPQAGIVRITNSGIRYIAKMEGFISDEASNILRAITDEQRIVVRIMFNHSVALQIKRDGANKKQLYIFVHEDGIISCENESSETVLFHCFSNIDDLLSYHICDFIPSEYDEPSCQFHFLVPTDKILYKEPHTKSNSQNLKNAVLQKLRLANSLENNSMDIERMYVEEWEHPNSFLVLHANNNKGDVGFLSFTICDNCIWCVYPFENNIARVRVMGSAEAQNKFCEFVRSFANDIDGD